MHKLLLALLVTACSSNICTMSVASMSLESATGEVDLSGTFDESKPILILTSSSGAATPIVCPLRMGSVMAASCDLKTAGIAPGSYTVSFDMTCDDASAAKDALALGVGVPAMLTVN